MSGEVAQPSRLLAVTRLGEGPHTTVLLHGFLGQGRNLRTLASRWLSVDAQRSFVLMDLPGHGVSPPLREGDTLRTFADDAWATVKSLGLPAPYTWVGHSLGGRVALCALEANPADCDAVAMLDIGPSPIDPEVQSSVGVLKLLRRAPAAAGSRKEMREFFVGKGMAPALADWLLLNVETTEGSAVKWRIDREALWRFHPEVSREDLWPVVERRWAPLTVVKGSRSPFVSPDEVRKLEALGARVVEVSSGHDVHVEATDAVVQALA